MLDTPSAIVNRIRRSAFAFPLVALAGLAMLLISEGSYWSANRSQTELVRLSEIRNAIQTLHRNMLDAETGQRGFLLTGRVEYLEPYRNATDDTLDALAKLRGYYPDEHPEMAATMARLDASVQAKMSELAITIGLAEAGEERQWRELMLSNIGKEKMDEIRAAGEQLLTAETNRVAAAREAILDTLMLNRIGIGAMTALSMLALFMYLRQTRALDAAREEQRLAVQVERDRLEREVNTRTAQLVELARRIETAREDERHHLARELHDELGALLTAAKLDAARLKSRIGATVPEALERINHLNETLNSGIALKRRIIEDLRPSALSNLGLVAALEILTREFAERSGIEVVKNLSAVELTPAAELSVYRLVQEALTNASKYAKARRLDVELHAEGSQVHVSVRDDGVGFDPALLQTSAHGLFGMRYRVEAEGGHLAIESAPGAGTRVSAVLPAHALAGPDEAAKADEAADAAAA
jgi:signal transduction histidine kinase